MHFDITIAGLKIFFHSLKLSRDIRGQCDTLLVGLSWIQITCQTYPVTAADLNGNSRLLGGDGYEMM